VGLQDAGTLHGDLELGVAFCMNSMTLPSTRGLGKYKNQLNRRLEKRLQFPGSRAIHSRVHTNGKTGGPMTVMMIPVTGQIRHANSEIPKTWILEAPDFRTGSYVEEDAHV